jgi:hypothetical protein
VATQPNMDMDVLSRDARINNGKEKCYAFVMPGRMAARKAMLPKDVHVRSYGRGFGV